VYDVKLYAGFKYGKDAEILGSGRFALVSRCGITRVFLYNTAAARHDAFEAWSRGSCGTHPCSNAHDRYTFEEDE
jgi:hypothetical protein